MEHLLQGVCDVDALAAKSCGAIICFCWPEAIEQSNPDDKIDNTSASSFIDSVSTKTENIFTSAVISGISLVYA